MWAYDAVSARSEPTSRSMPGQAGASTACPRELSRSTQCSQLRGVIHNPWTRTMVSDMRSPGEWSVGVLAGGGGRARLLGERGDRQVAAGGIFEHPRGLVVGPRVQLDQQVDHDLVLVVLVEADVREELARPVVAERGVRERVGRLRARARLDRVGIDGH